MHKPNLEIMRRAKRAKRRILKTDQQFLNSDKQLLADTAENIYLRAKKGITKKLEPVIVPRYEYHEGGSYYDIV
ncbi:MAG: hypothetical protein RLZZ283_412 [Candidatus Parcubacteria bacterium]